MTVKNSAVVPLFPEDENITPFPCNVPNILGLDYDRLAEAILRKTKEEENKKRAAAQKSAAEKRKTKAANGTVDPIKDKKDIIRIAKYFYEKGQYRNELLFLIGCSIGLRGCDLVDLKVGDINPQTYQIRVKEQKTGKYRVVTLNALAAEAYNALIESIPNRTKETYLFQSERKGNCRIDRHSFGRILRQAQHDLNLPYRLGTHSMRKTFAYHIFMDNQQSPEILAYLQALLNHRDSKTTLRYIGLEAERSESLYRALDFGFGLSEVKDLDDNPVKKYE